MRLIHAASRFLCFGVLASLATFSLTATDVYQLRPVAESGGISRMALTVEKTGLYRGKKHLFLFEKYQGSLDFDRQRPEASKIELSIDSSSVVCKDDWVSSGDLKKIMQTTLEDMLAVKRYPSMKFVSTAIKPLGGDRYEAQGTLTIRDLARPVTIAVTLNQSNPALLRLDGSAVIRLKDYKLDPPSALLGAIGTKNEMTFDFSVAAARAD